MMAFLAKLLTGVGGSWLLTPGLVLAALIGWHQYWQVQDGKLVAQGQQQCDAVWTAETFKQQRNAAQAQLTALREINQEGEQITQGLRDEIDETRARYRALQAKADEDGAKLASVGDRCLSDGVFDALRRRHGVGAGGKGAGSGS